MNWLICWTPTPGAHRIYDSRCFDQLESLIQFIRNYAGETAHASVYRHATTDEGTGFRLAGEMSLPLAEIGGRQ